jgi:hypothetical protein
MDINKSTRVAGDNDIQNLIAKQIIATILEGKQFLNIHQSVPLEKSVEFPDSMPCRLGTGYIHLVPGCENIFLFGIH